MAGKKFPQPPFKRFVKVRSGYILEPNYRTADIEPASYNKFGTPLFHCGWTITWEGRFADGSGHVTFVDKVIATADTREELENG